MNHVPEVKWLLIAGVLFAFQAAALAPETTSTGDNATQDTDQTQVASSPEPSALESSSASNSPEAAPSAASILDYEASEQVSEDLSVAFPVDI
jgi:cytoskeletal protein RodZ